MTYTIAHGFKFVFTMHVQSNKYNKVSKNCFIYFNCLKLDKDSDKDNVDPLKLFPACRESSQISPRAAAAII